MCTVNMARRIKIVAYLIAQGAAVSVSSILEASAQNGEQGNPDSDAAAHLDELSDLSLVDSLGRQSSLENQASINFDSFDSALFSRSHSLQSVQSLSQLSRSDSLGVQSAAPLPLSRSNSLLNSVDGIPQARSELELKTFQILEQAGEFPLKEIQRLANLVDEVYGDAISQLEDDDGCWVNNHNGNIQDPVCELAGEIRDSALDIVKAKQNNDTDLVAQKYQKLQHLHNDLESLMDDQDEMREHEDVESYLRTVAEFLNPNKYVRAPQFTRCLREQDEHQWEEKNKFRPGVQKQSRRWENCMTAPVYKSVVGVQGRVLWLEGSNCDHYEIIDKVLVAESLAARAVNPITPSKAMENLNWAELHSKFTNPKLTPIPEWKHITEKAHATTQLGKFQYQFFKKEHRSKSLTVTSKSSIIFKYAFPERGVSSAQSAAWFVLDMLGVPGTAVESNTPQGRHRDWLRQLTGTIGLYMHSVINPIAKFVIHEFCGEGRHSENSSTNQIILSDSALQQSLSGHSICSKLLLASPNGYSILNFVHALNNWLTVHNKTPATAGDMNFQFNPPGNSDCRLWSPDEPTKEGWLSSDISRYNIGKLDEGGATENFFMCTATKLKFR